jgi:hypothetical protein
VRTASSDVPRRRTAGHRAQTWKNGSWRERRPTCCVSQRHRSRGTGRLYAKRIRQTIRCSPLLRHPSSGCRYRTASVKAAECTAVVQGALRRGGSLSRAPSQTTHGPRGRSSRGSWPITRLQNPSTRLITATTPRTTTTKEGRRGYFELFSLVSTCPPPSSRLDLARPPFSSNGSPNARHDCRCLSSRALGEAISGRIA